MLNKIRLAIGSSKQKIALRLLALLPLIGIFGYIVIAHAATEQKLSAKVELEPDCEELLFNKFRLQDEGRDGYYVRAVQRGCNIISNPQKHASRFVVADIRCTNCHVDLGTKPQSGPIGQGWVQADKYDPREGNTLPFESRAMLCFTNSSNGYRPNIMDSVIQDIKIYARYLAYKQGLREGVEYKERKFNEVEWSGEGDDFLRGRMLYQEKCESCHGKEGYGLQDENGEVIIPAVAGKGSWNTDNMFYNYPQVLAAMIKTNMPKDNPGSLTDAEARDLAAYLVTLPRPAGNRKGVLAAAGNQIIMRTVPPMFQALNSIQSGN